MNYARIHRHVRCGRHSTLIAALFGACSTLLSLPAAAGYIQQNLVSDLPDIAAVQDPNLVNPWGISHSATSPIWVSDNGTGLTTLYNGSGTPQSLVVTIAPPASPPTDFSNSSPTGQVFNVFNTTSPNDFVLPNARPASFIFATEDGTISAWNAGTASILKVDNSPSGAVYKGLAIGNNGSSNLLYAANFNSGHIDVFDRNFMPTTVGGGFVDPNIPAGFAPFNVQNINGKLYVTYAKQDADKHDDVAGSGNGFVDVFDTNGNLLERLVSNGPLNSPWGLALAPGDFGQFSNDLLVGNFGDGMINAFDPITGALLGQLDDANGLPITIEGLWGLLFGNGGTGGATNELFFTAGIPGPDMIEDHGLFGDLTVAVPEPGSLSLLAIGIAGVMRLRRCRLKRGRS
jgi:uncharacterized protein (TIGR03118 family)